MSLYICDLMTNSIMPSLLILGS